MYLGEEAFKKANSYPILCQNQDELVFGNVYLLCKINVQKTNILMYTN